MAPFIRKKTTIFIEIKKCAFPSVKKNLRAACSGLKNLQIWEILFHVEHLYIVGIV